MNARSFALVFVALALVLGVAACGSSKSGSASAPGQIIAPTPSAKDPAPFPAPSDPMARTRAAGLVPEPAEELAYHVHSHLDVFIDAVHILVPAGLGIDTTNRGVHKLKTDGLPSYGGIVVPCDSPCISPLHTHDVTGILHTESSTPKGNTLGELFIEWNVRLDANCFASYCKPDTAVAVYVNGTRFAGDPRTITLVDRTEIAVVVGTPPARIPNTADWTQI